MFMTKLAPCLPRERRKGGGSTKMQVFSGALHLTARREGFKRKLGRLRTRNEIRADRIQEAVMRNPKLHSWKR